MEFKNSVNTYKIDMSPRIFPLLLNYWVTAAEFCKAESWHGLNNSHINHMQIYLFWKITQFQCVGHLRKN